MLYTKRIYGMETNQAVTISCSIQSIKTWIQASIFRFPTHQLFIIHSPNHHHIKPNILFLNHHQTIIHRFTCSCFFQTFIRNLYISINSIYTFELKNLLS
ncbi:hypothetical protein HanIR_Chr17g0880351 [Helianthus annuus]|nr:hypothetical protein HanIR_Chr17g0880351 [Helianthus annuus]